MLPGLNLPASLLCLLGGLRPCFTAPGFATFCGLVAGLAGRVRRRTVAGMPPGGCPQHAWPHDRAHYFFARARWELDQPGLAVAQLAVMLLAEPGADLHVAVDDSVFRRTGRKVHGAGWQHDGSSPAMSKLSYGSCFVTAGILVRLLRRRRGADDAARRCGRAGPSRGPPRQRRRPAGRGHAAENRLPGHRDADGRRFHR